MGLDEYLSTPPPTPPLHIFGCQDYEFFIKFITKAKIYVCSNHLHNSIVIKAKTTLNIQ